VLYGPIDSRVNEWYEKYVARGDTLDHPCVITTGQVVWLSVPAIHSYMPV